MAKSTGPTTNSLSLQAWQAGRWASNPRIRINLKSGLLGCCWAGSIPKPPASDEPISCQKPHFGRTIPHENPKGKRWAWSRLASTRDLSTIAFFRAGWLLRRNGPVPGILAAHQPGAIMDKSERPFCRSFWVPPKTQDRYPIFYTSDQPINMYPANPKCYLCIEAEVLPTF